jgi:hypothetical protein
MSCRRPGPAAALALVAVAVPLATPTGARAQPPAAPAASPAGAPSGAPAPRDAPDIVRGRVVGDSARPLAGAAVIVVRGPDRLTLQAVTDSAGRFSVRFDEGTGDYLVTVTAPGYRASRRRVQRQGGERVLAADFTLSREVATLAAVNVRGERPARASNRVSPTTLETGAAERWREGVEGQLSPTVAGDLNALAGTMPGVTLGANGPSILGSGGESNLTTLNGLGLAGASIPRAARTETRVTGATFDPTRGGFAGANIDVRLGPGDRFFQRRNGFVTLDAPQLQFTDAVGRAAGARSGGFRGSVGADGELVRQTMTYNVAVDVAHAVSAPSTLADAGAETLLRAGVAPDSVARVLAIAGPLGIPLGGGGIPADRRRDAVTWLGRLDDTRDTLRTRALTTYAGWTREGALGFGPLAAPSAGGERTQRTVGAQLVAGDFVGPGRRVLTESRLAASAVRTATSPYRALPGATVLVRSPTLDARGDVTGLTLGGGLLAAGTQGDWTVEGANETVWNARGRRHRFKALAWARGDGLRQDLVSNANGQYSFASLEDFAAGRASGYSRTLAQPQRAGTAWNGAAALAHQWTPSRWFNVLYGARVEASAFGGRPPSNPALERALGVRTGAAPTRLHVSPRAGFSYTYNRDRENGSGTSQSPVGRFYRTTAGVLRGGVGEFRDLLRPGVLADASAGAGLAGSTTCCRAWARRCRPRLGRLRRRPARHPDGVRRGRRPAGRARAVGVAHRPVVRRPRSWRATLDWNTNVGKWLLRVNGLGSYDLRQPGTVDANFGGAPASRSPARAGGRCTCRRRPSTRRAGWCRRRGAPQPAFGRVAVRASDPARLRRAADRRAVARRVQAAQPLRRSSARRRTRCRARAGSNRGFDGGGFGDPRDREWAAGAQRRAPHRRAPGRPEHAEDGHRHAVRARAVGAPLHAARPGRRDGDGRAFDRAFVPDPAAADPALAAQLGALLAGSPGAERAWRARSGAPRRATAAAGPGRRRSTCSGARPSAPLDRPPHVGRLPAERAGRRRPARARRRAPRLGRQAAPDPVLLVPRGFDAAARAGRASATT